MQLAFLRWAVGPALLCGVISAEPDGPVAEPDGAIAHPLRWSDPNGTPAGTRRSACLPLTNDVEEAWSVKLPGFAESPLVYWGREAYIVCSLGRQRSLVAIDVLAGTILAKKRLADGPKPLPVVWDGRVYLRTSATEIAEYRRVGRTFNRLWSLRVGEQFVSDPIIFDNEIYAVADGDLVRLRPRRRDPVWRTGLHNLRGRPALYGEHVYVIGDFQRAGFEPSAHLYVYRRDNGRTVEFKNAAWYRQRTPPELSLPGSITVTEKEVLIRGPIAFATQKGSASHVMLDRSDGADGLRIGRKSVRLQNYTVPPAMTSLGTLALADAKPLGWVLRKPEGGLYLSTYEDNPDLYSIKQRVGPTVLGDVVYFGSWAADIRTRRILWRLPVKSLKFPAVPIDGGVLIVDGRALRAFRARRSGRR